MDIVLIDDDSIGLFLTERLLKRDGLAESFTAFSSAQEGLAFLQQAPDHELPQVIFLDLNMPIMDGWDFLEAARPLEPRLLGRCYIYILTSSLSHSDQDRIEHFPLVAGLVHKPLDSLQIKAVQAQVEAAFSAR